MDAARSLTCSTTRLIALRVAGLALRAAAIAATPTAAPVAAAIVVFVMRVRLAFLPLLRCAADLLALRRAVAFFPLFRAEVIFFELFDAARFFEPPRRFALLLLEERFFDEERLLDELRDRLFDDFFEDRREPFLDAAMLCLLLNVRCGGNRNRDQEPRCVQRRWCTRCTKTM